MNRISFLKRAAMLLLVAAPATSLWAYEGSGSQESPYKISSASDLTTLASEVNGGTSYSGYYFQLTDDIDLNGVAFTPIGSSVTTGNGPQATTTLYPFSGQFDGAGHYISGINIDNNSSNNQGLFGVIGSGAIVKNLVLTNSYFDGKDNVGGIAGTNHGTIENCHVTKTVTIHASHTEGRENELKCKAHGGIAGSNGGTVTGCSSSAIISSANSTNKNQNFGGIVGQNGITIGNGPNAQTQGGTVSYNIAVGMNLSSCGEGYHGAIIGHNVSGTLTSNYYNGCILDETLKESAFGEGQQMHDSGPGTPKTSVPVDVDGGAEHGYFAALVGEYIIATTQSTITTVIVPAHLEDADIEKITYHIYESGEISFALTHNRDEFITDFVTSTEGTLSGTTLSLNDQNATVTAPWDVTVGDVTSVTYDGNTHYTPTIDITDASPSKNLAVTTDYTISFGENIPQDAGVYPITITGTGDYYGSVTTKKFEIEKRSVTLTSATDEKVYDGIALTNGNVTVGGDGFVSGEGATYNVTGTILDFGETDNTFTYTLNDGTKLANYNISSVSGTLKINKVSTPIQITAATGSKTYDGSALTNNGYTYTENVLASGDVLTAVVEGSITNAGSTSNNVTSYQVTRTSDQVDVTGNYTFGESVAGTLTVSPKAVTVTAQNKVFTYTGVAQSWPEYDVVGLVGNDAITAVVTGSITFPSEGPVTNTLSSYEFTAGTPGNYSVTTANGALTMTNASVAITITAASEGWTYDGNAHTNSTVTVTSGTLLTGDALVATATGRVTNVADTQDGNNPIASGYKIMNGDMDVTANYVITPVDGTLTINPIAVTVTAQNKEFIYTGVAQSWPEYDVVGLVGNDAITAVVTGSITFPSEGPVTNTLSSYEFTAGTPGNYSVTTANGALTMTNASVAITITAASEGWTYDGNAHTNSTVTVTSGTLLTGDALVATATGRVTNVADTQDGNNPIASGYKVMHGEEDVTANYAITAVAGKLTITPKVHPQDGWMTVSEYGGGIYKVAIDGDKLENCTSTETFTASEVTFTRTFTTEYATICLPFGVDITTANDKIGEFYQISEISAGVVEVQEVTNDDLAANTPYIVKPTKHSGSDVSTLTVTADVSFPLSSATDVTGTGWTFKGAKEVTSFTGLEEGHAVYFFASTDQKNDQDEVEIYAGDFVLIDNTEAKAAPFRAYLDYNGTGAIDIESFAPGRNASASVKQPTSMSVIIVNGDGTITKIGTIRMSGEDTWFTIDGIQIEGQPTEGGLYIRNGRAVMVK